MTTENAQKNQAGWITRIIGGVIIALSAVLIVLHMAGDEVHAFPWVGVLIGFGLIVVGYFQKIAAK